LELLVIKVNSPYFLIFPSDPANFHRKPWRRRQRIILVSRIIPRPHPPSATLSPFLIWVRQDSTPTHSYMKYLYKYPQREYPYERLIQESINRDRNVREFELLDTDCFDDDRYWDILIEYAKDDENESEICIRVWATNRGPDPASLHIIPQTVFRNTWSWGGPNAAEDVRPRMKLDSRGSIIRAKHFAFPRRRYIHFTSSPSPTNPENEVSPTVCPPVIPLFLATACSPFPNCGFTICLRCVTEISDALHGK